MEVHEDFTSKCLTLVFTNGKRVKLTRQESIEFDNWYLKKEAERKAHNS